MAAPLFVEELFVLLACAALDMRLFLSLTHFDTSDRLILNLSATLHWDTPGWHSCITLALNTAECDSQRFAPRRLVAFFESTRSSTRHVI